MKKIISILIVAALLMSFMVSAFAADTTPTVTVDTVTAEAGQEVTLNVTMSASTFAAFGMKIVYDEEALVLTKVTKGEAIDEFMGFTGSKKTGKVTGYHTEDLDVDGVIFTMTFTVLETATAGTYEVGLEIDSFNLADQSELEVTAVAGGIVIEEEALPTVTVGSANAQVGDELTLDVTMSAATFAAFGMKIVYDEEALELTKVTKGEAIEEFMGFTGSKKTGKVTGYHTEDMDVDGVLFTMTFNVLAAGEHTVSLEIDSFNLADQSAIEVAAVAGTVSVETPVVNPTIEDGVYYISYGEVTFAALEETYNFGWGPAGDVNNLAETDYITITNVADGQFTMQDCYGRYIYMNGTYNNFNVSAEMPAEGHLWVLEEAEGGYYIKNVLKEKYIAYSESYGTWGSYASISETSVLTITKVEEENEEPETLYEGKIVVETTDNNCWIDEYSMTAPVTGTYTFYIPAGLGVWEAEAFENDYFSNPIVDYYANEEGFAYTIDLNEGDVFRFYVGAETKQEWTITYTVVPLGTEVEPEDPTDPELPAAIELPLDTNISIEPGMLVVYQHTATGVETLTLQTFAIMFGDVTFEVSVNGGEAQAMVANDQLVFELVEGDVVTVVVNATGYSTLYATVETEGGEGGEGGEDPVDPTEPNGTVEHPYIIEELPYEGTQAADADLYYQWTATEDGTLYLYTEGGCSMTGSSIAGWEYLEGDVAGKYIQVAAGDVIIINVWNTTEFTLEFVPAECEHEYTVTDSKEATCTEAGFTTYTCSICGDSYTEEIPATGEHTYEAVVTEPTCTEAGCTTYTCSVCGDTYAEEIPATGHNYVDGICTGCGAEDPNVPTGDYDVLAFVLIAMMSVAAVVVVTTKKSYIA